MKLLFAVGTRPEAIKLAPLALELASREGVVVEVCATAQHREMLDQALALFGIAPDYDLDVMQQGQSLSMIASRMMAAFDDVLTRARPDFVIVQGDTTTAMACALAAFHRKIGVAHVEAGLRTGDRHSPFPEEVNRRITAILADWHFAPTARAREALLAEGVAADRIHVVGNTVVDALRIQRETVRADDGEFRRRFDFLGDARMVLITCHRREHFGDGLRGICAAIARLAERYPDTQFVYPVHPNPNVQGPVQAMLGGQGNLHLIDPQDYRSFLWLMKHARLIMTDSGGVQEEAPSLGTPVIVMRDVTERSEAIEAGSAILAGSDPERIVTVASRVLDDDAAWGEMANVSNPFGDGHSSARIADILTGAVSARSSRPGADNAAGALAADSLPVRT